METINKLLITAGLMVITSIGVVDKLSYDNMNKSERINYLQEQLTHYKAAPAIMGPQFGGMFIAHYARARENIQKEISRLSN